MLSRFGRPVALASLLAVMAMAGSARADVLFSNIGMGAKGYNPVASSLYDSFSTGNIGVALTSISVDVEALNPSDGGTFGVALFSNGANAPKGSLGRLVVVADSSLSSTPSILNLAGFSPIPLAANTQYWIRLFQVGWTSTSAQWLYDNSFRGTNVAAGFSQDSGNVLGVTANTSGSTVYLMQVSAVPEPGSVGTLSAGLLAIGLVFLRHRSAHFVASTQNH